jgi:hypothetical protein
MGLRWICDRHRQRLLLAPQLRRRPQGAGAVGHPRCARGIVLGPPRRSQDLLLDLCEIGKALRYCRGSLVPERTLAHAAALCSSRPPATNLRHYLGAVRAALRGQRYIAKALWAQLGFGRLSGFGVKLSHQGIDRHHNQEVNGSGDEDKCDQGVEKVTVLDDAAVDIEQQERKIRLVYDSRDERVDDISN